MKIVLDVLQNNILSVRVLVEEYDISKSTLHCTVTENLTMQKFCAKIISKMQRVDSAARAS